MENKLQRGRVAIVHGDYYRVLTKEGEILAKLAGKFSEQFITNLELPTVGDWVFFQTIDQQRGIIQQIEPRISKFSRKIAGHQSTEQLIASNVEIIVVLTKVDCCANVADYLIPLYELTTTIIVTGLNDDTGILKIASYLKNGKTGAFVGSSGVGKSTLVNRLVQNQQMAVSGIRLEDSKGRHTTTHRELLVLSTGGYIIDTPGMREFQLFEENELDATFQDIVDLAKNCRFNDCRHETENDCAVKAAIQAGVLTESRLLNYSKLQRELTFQERRTKQKERFKNKRKKTR